MGIKTIQLLLNETVSDVDTTKFWKDWVQFYASSPGYLIQNLPFNESLIQHAQSLNRRNRTDVKCSNANWSTFKTSETGELPNYIKAFLETPHEAAYEKRS